MIFSKHLSNIHIKVPLYIELSYDHFIKTVKCPFSGLIILKYATIIYLCLPYSS